MLGKIGVLYYCTHIKGIEEMRGDKNATQAIFRLRSVNSFCRSHLLNFMTSFKSSLKRRNRVFYIPCPRYLLVAFAHRARNVYRYSYSCQDCGVMPKGPRERMALSKLGRGCCVYGVRGLLHILISMYFWKNMIIALIFKEAK